MNYRHIYHAGNFADVFKHWVLTLILQKLSAKNTPFCLIDTHAGLGAYPLDAAEAQKTQEYQHGVAMLEAQKVDVVFEPYVALVRKYMQQEHVYPGSPTIMQEFLRDQDRLLLTEMHAADYALMKQRYDMDPRIKTFNRNGYESIKALLPPKERRGLVFIDPAFEDPKEFAHIVQALQDGLRRFATGVYMVWYPIKDRKVIDKFYRDVRAQTQLPILVAELHANQILATALSSCGLLIVNPPWQLDEILYSNLTKLLRLLQFDKGIYKLFKVDGEANS
ncbi:MAG TPA: 23S rRNA (adenine(2030)-N(6))-methyltransferase RlmJ [Gammaproteobacteria bacterium]|nr:23S rRNA (adenine(2030)-N(6))-methyltransferase RlmJ [Gammaproteobacteria bacterium]